MEKKEKQFVFSEIIDNKINGYAIGISFLMISAFLLNNNTYFYWTNVTYFISAIFAFVGVAGIGTELDKSKRIKGLGNLALGIIFLGIWIALFVLLKNNPLVNFFGIVFMVFGTYSFVRGILELFYSIWLEISNSEYSYTKSLKAIFIFVTQLCGLALTILNILKIFRIID